MRNLARFVLLATLGLAVAGHAGDEDAAPAPSEEKQAWKQSGSSWLDGFRKLGGAIADSIRGEENLKEEWKGVGEGFKGAGTDTADAVAESIDED